MHQDIETKVKTVIIILLVRHEVNGKHRVLAAYNIFTLEEAYRYNDRQ